jgi:predicted DNA-binding protein (MmcQ/YjbR family)
MTREDFINTLADKYSCSPDYPWEDDNESAVFRHRVSKKWFALLMNISADKIGKNSTEKIWVVNLKADKWNISDLKMEQGIYTAYHMNKVHWITVNLIEVNTIMIEKLLEESFHLTRTKKDF